MPSGWLGADWGNVPAWIGSILTSSSLVVASRSYRRSVADKSRERDEKEKEQLGKVSSWLLGNNLVTVKNGNDVAVIVTAYFDVGYQIVVAGPKSFGPSQSFGLRLDESMVTELVSKLALSPVNALIPILMVTDSHGRTWRRTQTGDVIRVVAADHGLSERMRNVGSVVEFEEIEELSSE